MQRRVIPLLVMVYMAVHRAWPPLYLLPWFVDLNEWKAVLHIDKRTPATANPLHPSGFLKKTTYRYAFKGQVRQLPIE